MDVFVWLRSVFGKTRRRAVMSIATVLVLVTAGAASALAAPSPRGIVYSATADFKSVAELSHEALTNDVYVTVATGDATVNSVDYFIDDATGVGEPDFTATVAPFAFETTLGPGSLKPGDHTLLAAVSNSTDVVDMFARFKVAAAAAPAVPQAQPPAQPQTPIVEPATPATPVAVPTDGTEVCETFGSTLVSGGQYMVQNNAWGTQDEQCIMAFDGGFKVTKANHNQDSVASFPNLMSGCWMGTCTEGTTLPLAISDLGPITSSLQTTTPADGKYNVAYDIWADPTPRTTEQNTGAELMIWLKEVGGIAPIGEKVDTATIGGVTYDVWTGTNGKVPVISWVRQEYSDSATKLPITDFVNDAVTRGVVESTWYLTNIQAGFEPWVGGQDMTVNAFTVEY